MDVSVNELSGRVLDWYVANTLGIDLIKDIPEYHKDWALTGPLIKMFNISLVSSKSGDYCCYGFLDIGDYHYVDIYPDQDCDACGDTPLLTICRTVVASKYGKTVTVPPFGVLGPS
ncbi:hypothetical protein [Lelliottia sp. RWM.1]|uniref:hypothetical protein n=1 Tax=Lelliottia sp. RWM.1 TaxID=2663242 RepID=UPI00193E9B3E|nr:hypothetical protein [Lelliottia sp. RWM.1]MBM3074236.1 hypothetical protein [Lelliottia sp. RWM.1]